jgi:hypothetical protein
MAYFEALDAETVAYFDEASAAALPKCNVAAFCKSLESNESHTALLVRQIRPNDVVEEVCLYRVDGER